MGVGSSLLYVPGLYAKTSELIALSREAAGCGGMYISHIRSEGAHLVESVDEAIEIARGSGAPVEIYHLKAAGQPYWGKLEEVIRHIDDARASGLRVTADMYVYAAGATGLDAVMPAWVREGGQEKWVGRLQDPATRARVIQEMLSDQTEWENFLRLTGADKILLIGFKNDRLKPLTGKTLAEVARIRGVSAEEAAIELVVEDDSPVTAVYFHTSEDNVRREVTLPYVSFGSDAEASNPDGVFRKYMTHPREYGNVPRLLGTYVREQKLLSLQEAIRKLTSLPASNLGLHDRGMLRVGDFADVVIFDPARIEDHATYEHPRLYSTGVRDVFVNGRQALKDGQPTSERPGLFVRGPGWTGWPDGGCRKRPSPAAITAAEDDS
jgi:N-acyl-D-amino-acid deacylase